MPARAAPTSLIGQLRYIREHWAGLLGDALESPAAPARHRDRHPGRRGARRCTCGSAAGRRRVRRGGPPPSFTGAGEEPEAFSSDSAWMPRLVLIAKSTYVWLDQLSRALRSRHPDARCDPRRGAGPARALGHHRAVADRPVGALGRVGADQADARQPGRGRLAPTRSTTTGSPTTSAARRAYANLRDRAWARGIRLASDMVPNHMGIDSRWVIEHPEWFLSLPEPPYPAYTYTGAGPLAGRARRDRPRGPLLERLGCRRHVQALRPLGRRRPLHLPRQRRHELPVERHRPARLPQGRGARAGHPDHPRGRPALPGHPVRRRDGARQEAHPATLVAAARRRRTASRRAPQYAMSQADFDARMPVEFWREVVDRVAAEVPGTLLLAEAFWMLEGYFVRTLGMHRVYNSAFMHMLRDEDGAELSTAHQGDPRVRPRDPQALRELHEQPRRGDRGRTVREGRQVLRRRDGHGHDPGPADARPRPGRGLRREVRDGVPAGHASTSGRTRGSWSGTSARSSRCSTDAPGSPRPNDFLLYDLVTDGGGGRRARHRVLQRLGPDALAGHLPRPLRVDGGDDPRVEPVRPQERDLARSG